MVFTLAGIVIDVKPVQPEKADSPIVFTPAGIVIDVKPVQPENIDGMMAVTFSPKVSVFSDVLFLNGDPVPAMSRPK